MHEKERFLGIFTYLHAMLYAKMFYGYDILKHEFIVIEPTFDLLKDDVTLFVYILCTLSEKYDYNLTG